jgi:hypothetical protein
VSRIHADLLALHELRWMERARALAVRSGVPFRPSAPPTDPHSASLSAYDIRCVLRAADLHRSTEELTELLRRGCNEPYLSRDTEVNIDAFMHNLVQSGLVHTTDHWSDNQTKQETRANTEESKLGIKSLGRALTLPVR